MPTKNQGIVERLRGRSRGFFTEDVLLEEAADRIEELERNGRRDAKKKLDE